MGRFSTLVGALVLVVAACSGTASPAPTAVPSAATPAATPAQVTPSPALTTPEPANLITVKVTFDGKACTYTGPAVVPAGSMLKWSMENTPAALKGSQGAALIVLPVKDGTTWEQILADTARLKQSEVPPWARYPGLGSDGLAELKVLLPAAANVGGNIFTQMTRPAYYVGCGTVPEETDKAFPAILIKVLKG